jgi:hypothetical protein
MNVLDMVTSIFGGGITGLIGTALQSIYQYKTKQLEIDLEKQKGLNELEQRKLDIQMQAQEWASRTQIAQITTQGETDKADAEALAESYKTEPVQYSEKSLLTHAQNWILVFLDAFRAIIRPGLTVYLCAITTLIYHQTRSLLANNSMDSFGLLERLVNTILYLTTSVVLWWFGSRNTSKPKA